MEESTPAKACSGAVFTPPITGIMCASGVVLRVRLFDGIETGMPLSTSGFVVR